MRTLAVNALRLTGPRTAMGRYLEHLAREWSALDATPFDRILFLCPAQAETGTLTTSPVVGVSVPSARRWPLLVWEQAILPLAARKAAVLYCPAYNLPLARRRPVVVANHGIYEGLPGEFSRWQRLRSTPLQRLGVARADRVIVNSASTRADLEAHFGADASRMEVIHPAASDLFFGPLDPADASARAAGLIGSRDPFVLFVGKLSSRRNLPNLMAALARARTDLALRHRLVVVGPNRQGLPLARLAAERGLGGALTYIPHLEHPDLHALYVAADLFALPTLHEGISWTMLEAMASGTPVLTVAHAALAEGGADAALAVPSASVPDLAHGLTQLLSSPPLRRRLGEAGRARAALFSWKEAARRALAVLDRVGSATDA